PKGPKPKRKLNPKVPMKTLHWKGVNPAKMNGTIWEDVTKLEDAIVEKTLNQSLVEEKFSAKAQPKKKPKKGGGGKKEETKAAVELIEGKRSYNVLIGLSRFKMSNEDIRAAVLSMNEEILNVDKLQMLIKYVPMPEEVQQIRDYTGEPEELAQCEQFFYQFVDMDNIKERLEMFSYKQTFKDTFGDNKRKVDLIGHTCDLLKENGTEKKIEYTFIS
ncbi:hypothetical protein RFI_30162, partial [Reticulomyxa filosa]